MCNKYPAILWCIKSESCFSYLQENKSKCITPEKYTFNEYKKKLNVTFFNLAIFNRSYYTVSRRFSIRFGKNAKLLLELLVDWKFSISCAVSLPVISTEIQYEFVASTGWIHTLEKTRSFQEHNFWKIMVFQIIIYLTAFNPYQMLDKEIMNIFK